MVDALHRKRRLVILVFFVILVAILFVVLITIFVIILVILISVLIAIEVHHGVLLILIFGDEIAHVLIRLLKLHLVHALALIPMQERLALVHFGELRADPLKHALNRRRVRHERTAHRRTPM